MPTFLLTVQEYSPPPGHMAFNPRSMSPLRDTVMHSSPSPIGWSADEHHAPSPSPGPAHPESQGRDSRKEKLLKGIDVDILPSDLRQNRALRMIPRSNPIVQEAEAAEEQRNTVILMPLPSASPVGKGRSGASTSVFYHPQHKLPDRREKKITLPPASGFERNSNTGTNAAGMALKKKASMKKANSIKSVTADGSPDDEKSHGQKPSSAKSTRSVGRSEEHQVRRHRSHNANLCGCLCILVFDERWLKSDDAAAAVRSASTREESRPSRTPQSPRNRHQSHNGRLRRNQKGNVNSRCQWCQLATGGSGTLVGPSRRLQNRFWTTWRKLRRKRTP